MARTRPSAEQIREDSIDSSKIVNDSVSSEDIKDGDVKLVDLDITEINAASLPFNDVNVNFQADFIQTAIEQVAALGGEAQYIDAYDSSGGLNIGNAWVDIPLNAERKKSISFLHSVSINAQEITIDEDTTIMFFAQAVTKTISGTTPTKTRVKVLYYTGSVWTDVVGSEKPMYNDQANYGSHGTAIGVLSVVKGEKLKIQMINDGVNVIETDIGSALTLLKFKGEKGEKGEQGDEGDQGIQGDAGVDGQDGAQGAQGLQGVQGEQGEQGDQGERGESGLPAARKDFVFLGATSVLCEHNLNSLVAESVFFISFSQGKSRLVGNCLVGDVTSGTKFNADAFTKIDDNDYTITDIGYNSITINFSIPQSGVIQVRN